MTPVGRYASLRMPYGITTGSEVFQRCMEQLFEGQPCAIVIDDILVWGRSREEHDLRLRQVMDRIRAVNLKLNPEKCRFRVTEVSYVGHLLTNQGVKPDPAKTAAIRLISPPEDKHSLQRFLGMTNYLAKFIPGYSEATAPLRKLLRQDVDWCWLEHHTAAFTKLKELIASPPVLQYFDVHQPVVLSADASQHGLGAVCLQNDRPVAFASRALTETESRYAQIEKELLALVYACTKFHHYIYGRPVTVETDHQPLITILKKPLHTASARLQRMMLRLQRYNLNVIYKRGKELYVADALSRAHLPSTDQAEATEEYEVMVVDVLSSHRVEELRHDTLADPMCRRLSEVITAGWPNAFREVPRDLRPFYAMREELTTDSGLLLRGQRFIIPHSLQRYYVKQLHQGHPGLEATKRRARETMFWPTIYSDIEKEVSRCTPCQPKEPLRLHDVPDLPWSLTAADVFEWEGKEHLVLVDSYSGWFEVDRLPGTTSATLVAKLKHHFATHGVPQQLMTDNAAYFTSREFQDFAHKWDFRHVTSSPLYPQSNGLAERAVRSAKHLLEKCARDGADIDAALLSLRNTPRNGLPSPAQRLLSRRTRAFIPMTKAMYSPKVETQVQRALTQARQRGKAYYDKSARPLAPLRAGQTVRMQTQRGHDRLAMVLGTAPQPNSYQIKAGDATYVRNRRHLLQTPETYVSGSTAKDPPAVAAVAPPPRPQQDTVGPEVSQGQGPVIVTRSGRVSKPSSLY
ncbi:hypothetical protein SKAU_G00140550 [Synaphobranchus kaupii]|uniref:Gypsy retrotransposon integrase-like protein 1 n=1 Tax=Synaphobranchus kaupii TaxID=118154 RepID=A0A9Q1J394_SYNKA|nr:hypothetical protein SKAU_G00140550 [Synaphobranchus kaupii]